MPLPSKVSLDEHDFRTLVRGGIVRKDGAEILLRDIGWDLMENEICAAREDSYFNGGWLRGDEL